MAKLVKFMDGKFSCWSRVDLDNSDPIWISVSHTEVMVKKSRWGILGEKLYKANAYESNLTASALLTIYWDDGIKEEYEVINNMTNILLSAFTLAAMVSKSATDLSNRLNKGLQVLAQERTLQSYEKLKKFENRVPEPLNKQANKSEGNTVLLFEHLKKIIPNKQVADEYFSLNQKEWDSYVTQMVVPDGWKKRYEYGSVMAFNSNTHMGYSIQLLFRDNISPANILIIGNYYPLGTLAAFTADIKNKIEKEAVGALGAQFLISANFVQTSPVEGIELTIIKNLDKFYTILYESRTNAQ
jgi:hypothetical protein